MTAPGFQRPIGSDGLNTAERQILDRFDAGVTAAEIAADLGMRLDRVRDVIGRLGQVSFAVENKWAKDARAACQAHAQALAATGRRYA